LAYQTSMDYHFRAFSFVDRIASVHESSRISGSYTIPAKIESFPGSLVAEAVGQLAAWAAMAAVNFERRPVAGLAGAIDLGHPVRPGQVLELTAELETVDQEACAYNGSASVDGIPVVRLHNCVGPMVPVQEFDDPQALRDRYALLRGQGAAPGAFAGVPRFDMHFTGGEPGKRLNGSFQVPSSAPLFADHFPRRPVFPGSLLMHLNLELASRLALEITPCEGSAGWALETISDVKLRTFIPPGEQLECEARLSQQTNGHALLAVETRNGKKLIGGARVKLAPRKTI
jgi:3-hydroxymyristoyl/3-hydroxydecanoyl-(acyl carrier protein) dehydratase